jgi:GTP 3',8-cyclase
MNDLYLIDYHKIMYHPDKLSQWLEAKDSWSIAKNFYPVYVEISLSGICNHRCKFCALDYLGYKGGFANFKNLKKAIKDMGKGGVKSICFSGEGEPLLFPKAREIIDYTKSLGIDAALVTNGTYLKKELLFSLSWLKVSIDAGTAKTHMRIHRPKINDFDKIMANLKEAVQTKTNCTIGGQMILLPDNYKEAKILARKLKRIGLDYLVIKPYSHNEKSITKEYKNISYDRYLYMKDELERLSTKKFQVIFRQEAMKKTGLKRDYKRCLAVPFLWAHIMTNGDVYSCGNHLGDERFNLGNYNKQTFKQIWEGEKRKKQLEFMKKFDARKCRPSCRMDAINQYLEKLSNPPEHVNFI